MHSTKTHQELRTIVCVGALVILACSAFFALGPATAINPAQFFFVAICIWLFSSWQTWKLVDLNRPDKNSSLYPTLGKANKLTLFRGGLIALTSGFLFQPLPEYYLVWIPGLLYSAAAILDRVDGYVARRNGETSLLGSELDTFFDALGLFVAPLLAIQFGKLHWSFFAVSLAYYVFIFGLYWRRKNQRPVYPLLPSQLRRAFAGFQMGFVAVIMLPLIPASASVLLGFAFMLPMLIGFFIDWLVVSGRIDGAHKKNLDFFAQLDAMSKFIFQPSLRIIIATLVFFILYIENLSFPLMLAFGLLATLILIGAGARLAALTLLILCIHSLNEWHQPTILFACSWLLLLGPGNYSAWRGDDIWVNRQDGAA